MDKAAGRESEAPVFRRLRQDAHARRRSRRQPPETAGESRSFALLRPEAAFRPFGRKAAFFVIFGEFRPLSLTGAKAYIKLKRTVKPGLAGARIERGSDVEG